MRSIRCQRCGNMFEYEGLPPPCCPDCKGQEEVNFMEVRALVKEYPGITALEVREHTGVSFASLMDYVESGDIELLNENIKVNEHNLKDWLNKSRVIGTKTKLNLSNKLRDQDNEQESNQVQNAAAKESKSSEAKQSVQKMHHR